MPDQGAEARVVEIEKRLGRLEDSVGQIVAWQEDHTGDCRTLAHSVEMLERIVRAVGTALLAANSAQDHGELQELLRRLDRASKKDGSSRSATAP